MSSLRRWASVGDAIPQSSSPNSRHISSVKRVHPLASTCTGTDQCASVEEVGWEGEEGREGGMEGSI